MLKNWAIIVSVVVMLLLTIGFIQQKREASLYRDKYNSLTSTNKAILDIGRGETTVGDPTIKLKEYSKEIQQDIKNTSGKTESVSTIVVKNEVTGKGNLITQDTSLKFNDFRLSLNADSKSKTVDYTLHQSFEINNIQTKLPNGTFNNYVELYELNGDKRVNKLTLTKFNTIHIDTAFKNEWKFWNPKLDLGFNLMIDRKFVNAWEADLGISIFSYGKIDDLKLRLMRLAIGIGPQDISIGLTPLQYNIASPLPIVNNIWLGLKLSHVFNQNNNYLGLNISAVL